MSDDSGASSGSTRPHRLKEFREGGLTDGTNCQAGHRHAELHAGNHAVQVAKKQLDHACPCVSRGHQLADAREPHGNKREFRRREKGVQRNQRQHADEANREHG